MVKSEELVEAIQSYLNEATNEEIDIFSSMFKALKEKQKGKYQSYLAALTNVESKFIENGDFEVRIPIQPLVNNSLNIVHGGITATLIDSAMGILVNKSLPKHLVAVTTELKINYLKPGVGKELICTASIIHKGSSIYVCEAKVLNDSNSLIAISTGSFFVINRRNEN